MKKNSSVLVWYRGVAIVACILTLLFSSCASSSSSVDAAPASKSFIADSEPSPAVIANGAIDGSEVFIKGRNVGIWATWCSNHEVTQGEYEKYCAYSGKKPDSKYGVGENYPAYYVSWYDALVYCNKRSIAEGFTPCYKIKGKANPSEWESVPTDGNATWDAVTCDFGANGYRLPTEAEWEYFARGGNLGNSKQTEYSGSNNIGAVAWYNGNSGGKAHEVTQKSSNTEKLYDMSGNVWEWCWDWYGSIDTSTSSSGAKSGSYRILRGGGWGYNSSLCTVACRNNDYSYSKFYDIGFRVVSSTIKKDTELVVTEKKTAKKTTGVIVPGATVKGAIEGSDVFIEGRTVAIPSLWVCDHEVTQAEYQSVMGENPSSFKSSPASGETHENWPVENISWYDALVYCNKLSIQEGRTPCYNVDGETDSSKWGYTPHKKYGIGGTITCDFTADGYRLPTEAEWEYCALGGNTGNSNLTKYSGSNTIGSVAWYKDNAYDVGKKSPDYGTHQVKTKAPNKLNLYDMSGNVSEWCWDWYQSINSSTPFSGASFGAYCVVRGGSFSYDVSGCAVSERNYDCPDERYVNLGFRVVRSSSNQGIESAAGENKTAKKTLDKGVGKGISSGVFVPGATIKGAIEGSAVFIEGRTVIIPSLWVCDHEVTQDEYELFCNYGNASPDFEHGCDDESPTYDVSWYDALVYCNKRSIAEGLTPCYKINGKINPNNWGTIPLFGRDSTWDAATCDFNANGYRLPTEAEWEYLARGANISNKGQTKYSGSNYPNDVAWYGANTDKFRHVRSVKSYAPNALGIYDMSGNVWEWCWDWYEKNISGGVPLSGVASGSCRVLRGGCYSSDVSECSVSSRGLCEPNLRGCNLGFRVVRTASKEYVEHVTAENEANNETSADRCCSEVFIKGRSVKIWATWCCDHEVTQGEYEQYCIYGDGLDVYAQPNSSYGVGKDYPAYNVSWYDALVYCNKRSIAEGLTPCYKIKGRANPSEWGRVPEDGNATWDEATCDFTANGYRLPTEAEWEYFACGGNTSNSNQTTYSGSNTIGSVAWYYSNGEDKTHEVKTKAPNALGLYDMSGNVWEWCWDRYGYISTNTPSTGVTSGSYRVARGGGYWDFGSRCTVYYRSHYSPNYRTFSPSSQIRGRDGNGFRVVRSRSE